MYIAYKFHSYEMWHNYKPVIGNETGTGGDKIGPINLDIKTSTFALLWWHLIMYGHLFSMFFSREV